MRTVQRLVAAKRLLALLACALALSPLYARAGAEAAGRASAPAAASAQKATPAKPVAAEPDCATLRRRYLDSAACYAPFLNVNGSIKPGALETCGPPVPNPVRECSSAPAY